MSESMSSPWIRDYLTDVAETYGAQLYNTPVSSKKKKVQLTDLLTYQEDSYVWAWISDKDYRVSVRISKHAANQYKSYRPMFCPRPLSANTFGNTLVPHISLEINYVSLMGTGGYLFGNPRELESNENMKDWVLGLRQDGGGGNVLKLRKQQDLLQDKKAPPSLTSPPPFLPPPAPQSQGTKVVEDVVKPKREQSQDFKRAYAKRWRKVEVHPWKFATKPAVEERFIQLGNPPVEPLLNAATQPESRGPLVCLTSPHHTPSPTPLRRQGTPTDWSPSNRGSPVAPSEANTSVSDNENQQRDKPEVLPIIPHPPSDTEGHATMDTAITSDTYSLQLPTPGQRAKRSPIRSSSLPPRSSPEPSACPSPRPSKRLPRSSPPPPSSSLPLLSSSLSTSMGIRKNIQRKVPHPGLPFPRPDFTKQGPVQILVPNSDTSGTGSSQSYSQSQYASQPQQCQYQLLSHSPAFPSSLAKEYKPPDVSTPGEEKLADTSIHLSKMSAESSPVHGNTDRQETTYAHDKYKTETTDARTRKWGSGSNRSPAASVPKIEILEVGRSDTEEEIDELELTHSIIRTEAELDTYNGVYVGEGGADADHEDNQLFIDKAQIHSTLQGSPPRQFARLATAPVVQHPPPNNQDTDVVRIHHSTQPSDYPGSQSSMHSLFSDSQGDGREASSCTPILPVCRTEDKASPARVPRHDPEAWKEPSFVAMNKAKEKARAIEELDVPSVKVSKRCRRSPQHELSVRKVAVLEVGRGASNQMTTQNLDDIQPQGTTVFAVGKIHSNDNDQPSISISSGLQLSKPRLASFIVDFERMDLGKRVPMPRLGLERDIKSMLLRTGRIRTLRKKVENDGSVYIVE